MSDYLGKPFWTKNLQILFRWRFVQLFSKLPFIDEKKSGYQAPEVIRIQLTLCIIMIIKYETKSYLQSVFKFLPPSLAQFLRLSQYNQHFILRELVNKHCDNVIKEVFEDQMKLSPLELYAISRQLKTPCQPTNIYNFFVILFCRCLALLKSKKVDDINDGYQML